MAKARGKANPKAAPKKPPRAKKERPASASTEVEKRWSEYWRRRKQLEDAVEAVRSAREALNRAVETEREERKAFEEVKSTLTELLDVAPAGANTQSEKPRLVAAPDPNKQASPGGPPR